MISAFIKKAFNRRLHLFRARNAVRTNIIALYDYASVEVNDHIFSAGDAMM
jgi:hypothetical protein